MLDIMTVYGAALMQTSTCYGQPMTYLSRRAICSRRAETCPDLTRNHRYTRTRLLTPLYGFILTT